MFEYCRQPRTILSKHTAGQYLALSQLCGYIHNAGYSSSYGLLEIRGDVKLVALERCANFMGDATMSASYNPPGRMLPVSAAKTVNNALKTGH